MKWDWQTTIAGACVAALFAGAATFCLVLFLLWPDPWRWILGGGGAILGIMALATLAAAVKLSTSLATGAGDPPESEPEPEQPKPGWEVVKPEPSYAYDMDHLISALKPQAETCLIQALPTLSSQDPLTHEDLGWLLWASYTLGKPSRRSLVGRRLPSGRKLTRYQYDQTVDVLCQAGIVVDRHPGTSGKFAPGLTLSQALHAAGIDPESLPLSRWATGPPGQTGLGRAGPGTSHRFLVTRIVESEK